MNITQGVRRKRYGFFALSIIMLLSGGVILLIEFNDPLMLSLGSLMCILSAYLVRKSNVHGHSSLATSNEGSDSSVVNRLGPVIWVIGLVVLVALGVSFLYLYRDAVNGYHEILPVYLFAGAVLVCAGVWSYLISKLMHKSGQTR